jgi:calcineurin-like phosphoesterase family protein
MKWFTSDSHFNHANIINWRGKDNQAPGERYRPFESMLEMNEEMRRMWNLRVKPDDTVYHLGDVAFAITRDKSLDLLEGLNGTKELIMGNHDTWNDSIEEGSVKDLTRHFHRLHGCKEIVIGSAVGIMTHIPVHPQQLETRYAFNLHGHLHRLQIEDPRYINVSVELHEYGPISEELIHAMLSVRGIIDA